MGFRQGGQPGYGLRRLLVSAEGTPKQVLNHGERKSLASDRVIQIPGPPEELRWVREIYRLFIQDRMSFLGIAQELNRLRIPRVRGAEWDQRSVKTVLTHPKYAGVNQYGRFSTRLYTPKFENPRSDWAFIPGAFEALVEPKTFEKVQEILATITRNRSDEKLLDMLRVVLAKEGKLTIRIIENTPGAPSPTTIRTRFGSISRAYKLVGFEGNDGYTRQGRLAEIRHIRYIRQELMNEIVSLSSGQVKIEDRGKRFRTRLKLRNHLIAVVVCRCFRGYKDADRWMMKCVSGEKRLVTVLARLNSTNDGFMDYFVVPPIRTSKSVRLLKHDPRLDITIRLDNLGNLADAVRTVLTRNQTSTNWRLDEKSTAIATDSQLRRLAKCPKRELIRRAMNQKTLERIFSRRPVRPSKLAKCLTVLRQSGAPKVAPQIGCSPEMTHLTRKPRNWWKASWLVHARLPID